jgi:hypothetical protein
MSQTKVMNLRDLIGIIVPTFGKVKSIIPTINRENEVILSVEVEENDNQWTEDPPTVIGWYWGMKDNSIDIYYFDGMIMKQGHNHWGLKNFQGFSMQRLEPPE